MHLFLLRVIGDAQNAWQIEAIEQYILRLQPFARVQIQIGAEQHGRSSSPNPLQVRTQEATFLLKNLPPNAVCVALDEHGKNASSIEFAQQIERWSDGGRPIVFFLGGSWGLGEEVLKHAHTTISFGKQTLPHIFARILLLEQLYRAETILRGKEYHK